MYNVKTYLSSTSASAPVSSLATYIVGLLITLPQPRFSMQHTRSQAFPDGRLIRSESADQKVGVRQCANA